MFEAFLWLQQATGDFHSDVRHTCLWHVPDSVSLESREYEILPHFCFPDFKLQILHRPVLLQKDLYVFILTKPGGERRYGICLRSFCSGEGNRYDVKRRRLCCLCIVTEYPSFTFFYNLLLQVHSMCLRDHDTISSRDLLQLLYTKNLAHNSISFANQFSLSRRTNNMGYVPFGSGKNWCSNVPILPLLESLGAQRFLFLLTSIMCEKRILFVAENVTMLSARVFSALSMLYPFQWQVVSLLINSLIEITIIYILFSV